MVSCWGLLCSQMPSTSLLSVLAGLERIAVDFVLDPGFGRACASAFGREVGAEAYLAALASLPPVSVVAAADLLGAFGAYASNPARILVAESLLLGSPAVLLAPARWIVGLRRLAGSLAPWQIAHRVSLADCGQHGGRAGRHSAKEQACRGAGHQNSWKTKT